MTLNPSTAIEDLKTYIRRFSLRLSKEAESIFLSAEETGFRLNTNPLPSYFLFAVIAKAEDLRSIIKEKGGNPDSGAKRVLRVIERTSNPQTDWYDQPKCLYSNPGRNAIRAQLIDRAISAVIRNQRAEITWIDVAEALLEIHELEFPPSTNKEWTDEELNTSYNTLSHIAGTYIESIWIRIDEIGQDLHELSRQVRQREKFRQQSEQLLTMFDKLVHLKDARRRGYLLQDLLNRTCQLHGIPVHKSFTRNKGAEQIDGAFRIDGWHYIVECRWRKKIADIRELDGLLGQVNRSGKQTMGLFLSINGWSTNVPSLLQQNPDKSIVLMNGSDLRSVLDLALRIGLGDFISAKVAKLNLEGEPFLGVTDYLREKTAPH